MATKNKTESAATIKELKEVYHQNKLILESAGEGIYGLDEKGKTTFVNPAVEKMTGFSAKDVLGKCQHKLMHHSREDGSPYPREECHIYAAFRKGKTFHALDEVFWRKDGTSFPVEYVSTPIWENMKIKGAVVIFKDITERKQAEKEIQSLKQRLELENAYLREEIREATAYGDIIGISPTLAHIISQIEMVAPTEANVLVTGESGTGKELVAREIHNHSARKENPIIKVNCASIPRELYESEFFGHVKGSFTGAVRDRAGRFDLADGGTLFLDEVGEIPLDLQSKLLRVLQEGTYERIGDEKTRKTDVRIIAATNRNLKSFVEKGKFREDLYYRLNVFPIEVPPLRKRTEDIPLLAQRFLELFSKQMNRTPTKLTKANMAELQCYSWPGNIRELQNVIERAAIVSGSGKLRFDLPNSETQQHPKKAKTIEDETDLEVITDSEMKRIEKENIIRALDACNWKVSGEGGAAELLEIPPTTLASKIKKLKIKKSA
jgi:formate hydrogenlyase transcriptional activator